MEARLSGIAVANAPCSWGVVAGLEGAEGPPGYAQVLDEMAQAGYAGTELGDWGFMPTDAVALRSELSRRGLALVGAFVPVALADRSAHTSGLEAALRTARLLAAYAAPDRAGGAPFIVLSDDNAVNPERVRLAGRIQPQHGLSREQWRMFAEGAQRVAATVREETGLRTAFHHHCGGFVETPAEVETLMELTDPQLIGLCLDTGHYAYGGGDPLEALRRFAGRVWHVHIKDCDGRVAGWARNEGWDYFTAVRNRVFCELGEGQVDFASVLEQMARQGYRGWVVVEDEMAPGTGTPLESARRDREFLRRLGL